MEVERRQEGRGGLDPQSQRDLVSERAIIAARSKLPHERRVGPPQLSKRLVFSRTAPPVSAERADSDRRFGEVED
jgi:hypothetical protein